MSTQGLKQRIKDDMVQAMRDKNKERLNVIRLLQAAIKQKEVDERVTLDDAQIIAILEKMIKQGHESAKQFKEGNRLDLANKELQEITVLETYMPTPLSEDELNNLIKAAIKALAASSIKDMGKVMNALKGQVQGRANMTEVSHRIKQLLS